ncbi:MAG: tRNA pseudouridine(13) synthase TruD [Candidatus Aenigmarchaeota archaeon]|nr:tRNA pseudouridine(13) synthase TruD [Candidatus Aenigmarchaeota archaeon]
MHAWEDTRYKRFLKGPEDFQVDELLEPGFASTFRRKGGTVERAREGRFALCLLEKRERTTDEVLRELASQLQLPLARIGCAGMKDKHALTRQHLTIPGVGPEDLQRVTLRQASLRFVGWTDRWLEKGRIAGNRFTIRLHGIPSPGQAKERLRQAEQEGFPNLFGPQRFGERNADVGRLYLQGKLEEAAQLARGKTNKHLVKFYINAYQSLLFNLAVEDYARKGGKPLLQEVQLPGFRAAPARHPLDRDMWARARQDGIRADSFQITPLMLSCAGAGRAAYVRPADAEARGTRPLVLQFSLPSGSYATSLLQELLR